jgi:hypothetical protein
MQRGFAAILFLIGLAIVLLLGGGLYYVVQPSLLKVSNSIQSSPPSKTSSLTDETFEWETYRDTQYRYSFKYPKNWTYKSSGNNTQYQSNLPDFLNKSYDTFFDVKNNLDIKGLPLLLNVSIYNNTQNWTLERWVNQLEEFSGGAYISQENIQVAGNNAIRAKVNPAFEVIYGSYISTDKKTNILYSIGLGGNGEGGANYSDADPFVIQERANFKKFLSTFKFLQ